MHPLDRRFGRALRQHEQAPRPEAWKRLEARMGREETRRIIPFWVYGVAASVALLLLAGVFWLRQLDGSGKTQPQLAATQTPAVEKPTSRPMTTEPTVAESPVAAALPAKAPQVARRIASRPVQPTKVEPQHTPQQPETVPVVEPELKLQAPVQVATVENNQPADPQKPSQAIRAQVTPSTPAVEPTNAAPTTLVVTLANTDFDEKSGNEQRRKRNRLGRILRQLDNAKHGDRVDWNEVGINPPALLARAEEKLDRSTDKVNEGYRSLKEKTAF